MTHCSDIDTLVSLSELLGDRTLVELRHVLECDECREQIQTLATLRAGLGHVVEPEPAFTDAVLSAIGQGGRGPGAFLEKWVALVGSPVLAAFTVLLFLVQAAGAGGASLGLHVPILAGLAGVGVALWNRFAAGLPSVGVR
jgi:predicted anti-sigma-YlaC factor YlaD